MSEIDVREKTTMPIKKTVFGIACSSFVLAIMLALVGAESWSHIISGFATGMFFTLFAWDAAERP